MSVITTKLSDLRVGAVYTATRLINLGPGTWDKFMFNGRYTGNNIVKGGEDFVIGNDQAIALQFNRDELADKYMKAAVTPAASDGGDTAAASKAGATMVESKTQGDILASMQQAIGLRYSSRMRHIMAAASRLRAIGRTDAEIIKLRAQNV